jgi:hypothetical protein
VALRITRPGDSGARASVATGPTETPATNAISTFDVRFPIQTGDALGIDCCDGSAYFFTPSTGVAPWLWNPRLVDGEEPRPGLLFPSDYELLINADIEPDEDGDGFGDETQDQCPTDASTQGQCPPPPPDTDPPETEITKSPANKSEKPKAKYKFSSDEPDSTFECSLKGKDIKKSVKQFGDCDSPRKYKGLDDGKFKFKVRAIDAAGNVDLSPAKDKFKVVD